MKKNRYINHLQLILLTIILASCSTTMDLESRLDDLLSGQTMVLPIGSDTVTLDDLLATFDSAKYIGTNGNDIFVKYKDTMEWALPKFDLLENAIYEDEHVLSYNPLLPFVTGDSKLDLSYKLPIDFSGTKGVVSIERAELLSAKLEIKITVEDIPGLSTSDVSLTAHLPQQYFELENPSDSVFTHPTATQPLIFNTYQVAKEFGPFSIKSLTGTTMIPIKIDFHVNLGTKIVLLQPTSKLKISYRLTNVVAKAYYGTFAPEVLFGTKEDIYDASELVKDIPENGIFKLTEPQLNINLLNHSGVGFELLLDSLKAYKSDDASIAPIYALFNGQKSKTQTIARKLNFTETAPTTTVTLDHTSANGDIARFFDKFPLPDRIYSKLRMKSSFKAGDPMEFFTPNDKLVGQLDVKIPLKLNAGSSYTFKDTITNVDLDFLDANRLDTVCMAFKVVNKFPVKGQLSVEFLDMNLQPIEDLFLLTDSVINAPKIDDQGEVVSSEPGISYIILKVKKTQIAQLAQVKNIAYQFTFESEENKKITFRKENSLSIRLGLYLNGENLFNFE